MFTYNRSEITDCYSLLRNMLMKCSEHTQYNTESLKQFKQHIE